MTTLAEHRAAVALEYPTPEIVWYLHVDDPMHVHDDQSVAYSVMTDVEGNTLRYEAAPYGAGDGVIWRAAFVQGLDIPRRERPTPYGTFALLRTAVEADFERLNEQGRIRIAVQRFAREQATDVGIGLEPAPVAGPSTATLAGIRPNSATLSHWTLSPSFHRRY